MTVEFQYRKFRNLATEELGGDTPSLENTIADILQNSILRQVQTRLPTVLMIILIINIGE